MSEAPAIGYSVTANIGGDRQIVLQHFVGADESDEAANTAIDRIMRFVDRLQAIAKVPDLQKEKRQIEGQLLQSEKDLLAVEQDYQLGVVQRNETVLSLAARKKQEHEAGYNEHVSTGRRGEYKPVGHRLTLINRIEAEEHSLIEAAAKADAEREHARQNLEQNNHMRRVRIAQIDDEIADLQSKV